jgi:hypothetical protein
MARHIKNRLLACRKKFGGPHKAVQGQCAPHKISLGQWNCRSIFLCPTYNLAQDGIFTEYKGALAEQFVMQELSLAGRRVIGYWTNERSTSEVDFVVQQEDKVIPIEVKSGENLMAKSFKLFCEKFKPQTAIRASLLPYKDEGWMQNWPLWAVGGIE